MHDLKHTKNEAIEELLRRLIPYMHINGTSVTFDDFIVLDVLSAKGSYFPTFHTDVEWSAFNGYHGCQIWILIEPDSVMKPRGNMFIMDTDIVGRGMSIDIQKDHVNIVKNNTQFTTEILHSFKTLGELKPKIKYLNMYVGEVFIMNSCVFHASDPIHMYSDRLAINMRLVHKPSNILRLGDLTNNYSKLLRTKHSCTVHHDFCEFNFQNKYNRFKFK